MTILSTEVIEDIQFIESTPLLEGMQAIEASHSREAMEAIEALEVANPRYTHHKIDDMQVIMSLKMLKPTWLIEANIEANQTIESMQVIGIMKVI